MRGVTRTRILAIAALVAGSFTGAAFGHTTSLGTFDDIADGIFERKCALSGCHVSQANAGGLSLQHESAWAELLDFGFGKRPTNSAAASNLKMRVDPGRPWNSYLIDVLRGHFKFGEGPNRMPFGAAPLSECEIREIERWILAGAGREGFVEGDENHSGVGGCNVESKPTCVIDPCDPAQPALEEPAGASVRLGWQSGPLAAPDAAFETDVSGSHAAGFVTRIEMFARAGTDHVTITRDGDEAPLMVALGDPDGDGTQVDVLELPPGTGVPVAANQIFHVRQVVAGGRFDPAAVAEAAVHLTISTAPGLVALEPFLEDTGTASLVVPARGLGAAGGVLQDGAPIAALRVWTDRRATRSVALGSGGIAYEAVGGPSPYAVPADPIEPARIGYACEHDNTHLLQTPRWGCGEIFTRVSGYPVLPPGMPALAGGEPAPFCEREADCDACAQPPCCVPANLVGGGGAEDGRCTLVGLRYSAP